MFYKTRKISAISILILVFSLWLPLELYAAGGKHIVVIDPAHGGQDTGVKIKDNIDEKDITLILAIALRKELTREDNLQIILTRDSDRELSLEERKKIVVKMKPDFFLSIHVNSGFGKNASGFELYYPGFKDMNEGKKAVNINVRQAQNKYLNDSVRMAHLIQKNLDALFPRKGRGLREADLPIMDGLAASSLVVEIGFATNSEDKRKLLSPDTQVEVAGALAKSIKSFFR